MKVDLFSFKGKIKYDKKMKKYFFFKFIGGVKNNILEEIKLRKIKS